MKTQILVTLMLFTFFACNTKDETSNADKTVKNLYTIIEEKPHKTFSKCNLKIELINKVDESILKNIALELRESRQKYDKLWIMYFIKGGERNIAWAYTNFTPHMNLQIIGSTVKEDSILNNSDDISGEIIGKWKSEQSLMGAVLILYKDSTGNLSMRTKMKEGGILNDKITVSKQNGKTRYDDGNKHGEYYILENNGNLGMYTPERKFDEAIKLD